MKSEYRWKVGVMGMVGEQESRRSYEELLMTQAEDMLLLVVLVVGGEDRKTNW